MSRKQHQPLRVPSGWKDQDRALVIQVERLFDEVFSDMGSLGETATETKDGLMSAEDKTKLDGIAEGANAADVSYDSVNMKITKTINGTDSDVVAVSTIKSALGSFTWGELAGE